MGVCLDTCHIFSAGYKIQNKKEWENTIDILDSTFGIDKVKAVHLNDSKCEFESKKDRHEKIGKGKIGIECFKFIMNDNRFANIPLILETPAEDYSEYKDEVEMLNSYQGLE